MRFRLFASIFVLLTSISVPAQDFVFSQFFAAQPYLNPALTGFFDGSYRINVHGRNQWMGIGSGINTYGVNGEFKFGNNDPEDDYLALGVCLYRDEVFKRVNYHTGRINGSFTKRLGYGRTAHYLGIGMNIGMDNKSVNDNFVTPDGLLETPDKTQLWIPNMGLGLNYQIVFPSFANIFVGGAVDHLVSDKASIFVTDAPTDKKITLYSTSRLRVVEDRLFLLPTILHVRQATHTQTMFGVATQLLTRNSYITKANFQVGIYTRMGNESLDAIIGMFRYENRGIQLGISYDHNVSELNSTTGGYGALELSLGYIGLIERVFRSRAECPNLKNF